MKTVARKKNPSVKISSGKQTPSEEVFEGEMSLLDSQEKGHHAYLSSRVREFQPSLHDELEEQWDLPQAEANICGTQAELHS